MLEPRSPLLPPAARAGMGPSTAGGPCIKRQKRLCGVLSAHEPLEPAGPFFETALAFLAMQGKPPKSYKVSTPTNARAPLNWKRECRGRFTLRNESDPLA